MPVTLPGGYFDAGAGGGDPDPGGGDPQTNPEPQNVALYPTTMFLSEVTYLAQSAGQKAYVVPFNFLREEHVHVEVDGVETADFTLDPTGTVMTLGASVTILGGESVRIFRQTPSAVVDLLVEVGDGSGVSAQDFNTNTQQVLFVAQEAVDRATRAEQLLQSAQIGGGNLPTVSVAENGQSLYVVSGAFTLQTPAQARAILELTSRATTPFVEQWALFTLQADHPIITDTTSGWTYKDTAKIPVVSRVDFHDAAMDIRIASGGNDIRLVQPGKYLVEVSGGIGNTGASVENVAWALTDEENDPTVTVFLQSRDAGLNIQRSAVAIQGRYLLETTGEEFLALRAVKRAVGTNVVRTRMPVQILVSRIRD